MMIMVFVASTTCKHEAVVVACVGRAQINIVVVCRAPNHTPLQNIKKDYNTPSL